jgi:hypothetical protein
MPHLLSGEPLHDPLADPAPGSINEIKCTTCYMCACRCGIRVHLRDGAVRYIDGNPQHPLNQGVICAKGASGIMKQLSPARLTRPLLRKPGSERGAGEFEPISWDRAMQLLTERLGHIRATDPKKFALFTGRDQMQALTGLFARQFGTPNYAAHGGFCSVNMAAGMIYTVGGSFWEFGGPDLDRAKLFVMIGTAEDHHSNPMKIALSKFKRAGHRFISINPIRTGYSAIADEWIPIKPGTDGALFMALLHELIRTDTLDHAFLKRFTNAPQLVVLDAGEREGLFAFDPNPDKGPAGDGRHPHNKLVWDRAGGRVLNAYPEGIAEGCDPALEGHYTLEDGTRVAPSFQLLRERVASCTPEWAAAIIGIPAERIRADTGLRAADPVDRCLGQASPDYAGPAAGLPCDARPGGAFQRFPDGACAGGVNERARHHRRARRLPSQGALPAPHCAQLPCLQCAGDDPAEHAAERGAAGLSGQPRRAGHQPRWFTDPHRPRVLVGASVERARVDAQRHRQCRQGRPLPHRHAADLHGQHGLEQQHEHHGRARDAQPQGRAGRVHDSLPGGVRRLRQRDRGVRRPGAARHHLPRAPRRDEHARPADQRVRRTGRFGARSGAAAQR